MSPAYKELADTQHLLQRAEERLEELEVDLENAKDENAELRQDLEEIEEECFELRSYAEELEERWPLTQDQVLEGMLTDLEFALPKYLHLSPDVVGGDGWRVHRSVFELIEYLRSKGVVRQ